MMTCAWCVSFLRVMQEASRGTSEIMVWLVADNGVPCFFSHTHYLLRIHIAQNIEQHVLWMIQALGKAFHVGSAERSECFRIAQDIPSQRMSREYQALKLVVDMFRRQVTITFYLVYDNLNLARHLLLGIGAAQGKVEQEVDGAGHMLLWRSTIIHRFLFARIGIQFPAHIFHAGDNLSGRTVLGSLERHVFGEMRHAALTCQFVARAGPDGNAHIDGIRLPRSTDDTQALGQGMGEKRLT